LPIILYDGVCGLCNRFVRFVLKRDKRDQFRFAAIQSAFSKPVLERHGINPDALDTVYLVLDHELPGEQLASRTEAVEIVLTRLGGICTLASKLMAICPRRVSDWGYNLIAGSRYRYFGKYDACPIPAPRDRHRFLDLASPGSEP